MEDKTAEEKFLAYVNDFIEDYKDHVKLIKNGEVLPQFLNKALGTYGSHSATLVGEYARLTGYITETKKQYQRFWDKAFMETRTRLQNEATSAKTISVKEIESACRAWNDEKYYEFQDAISGAEQKQSFIGDLIMFWKRQDSVLNNLSYNSRSEMRRCLRRIGRTV